MIRGRSPHATRRTIQDAGPDLRAGVFAPPVAVSSAPIPFLRQNVCIPIIRTNLPEVVILSLTPSFSIFTIHLRLPIRLELRNPHRATETDRREDAIRGIPRLPDAHKGPSPRRRNDAASGWFCLSFAGGVECTVLSS